MNEEGKFEGLPVNDKATELAESLLYDGDFIVGDVLVCTNKQIR